MLRIFQYRLPFRKAFTTAGHTFANREGLIVTFSEDEIIAYGEIAPLPGFSGENLDEVREVFVLNRDPLQKALHNDEAEDFIRMLDQIHQFPSLSFGLDTLRLDLEAKRNRVSLRDSSFNEPLSSLPVNAVLSIQDQQKALSDAKEFITKGYKTLKVKVGKNFNQELDLLQALRESFPDIKLRIDANQAWETEEAIENLRKLESLNIEYCEQPVSADDLSGLRKVSKAVQIPIAADESVRNKNTAKKLIETGAADILIIKPMLMGTFQNISVTKRLADTHNISTIFTTSLESGVGRSAIAALASGLASSQFAQGLSTGNLLQSDITADSWMGHSVIRFPDTSGLGISVHLEQLEELN